MSQLSVSGSTLHERLNTLYEELRDTRRYLTKVADNVVHEGLSGEAKATQPIETKSLNYRVDKLFEEARWISELVNRLDNAVGEDKTEVSAADPRGPVRRAMVHGEER